MYIKIGPYKNWIGPYQLTDLLQKVGVSEDQCDKLGMWLSGTKLSNFCTWVDSKRKRKIHFRIDKYDTWNMESTLSYIIIPMLKQLKETKHGSPSVDNIDVPKGLHSYSVPGKENESEIDDNWHDRWDWVLDEMIWAFEQINEDWELTIDKKDLEAHNQRMKRGFILFGKYYQDLWD